MADESTTKTPKRPDKDLYASAYYDYLEQKEPARELPTNYLPLNNDDKPASTGSCSSRFFKSIKDAVTSCFGACSASNSSQYKTIC